MGIKQFAQEVDDLHDKIVDLFPPDSVRCVECFGLAQHFMFVERGRVVVEPTGQSEPIHVTCWKSYTDYVRGR